MNGGKGNQIRWGKLIEETEEKMTYYKAFDKDLKCRGIQYEIGKTYEMEERPEPCKKGFHFCRSVADCYNYYPMESSTRVCKVEPLGEIATDDDVKYCTNKLKILEEIDNPREKSNTGNRNTGYSNTGNRNTGDWNTGNRNTGDCNTGYRNTGDCNTGYSNTGNRNTGDCNTGYSNTGNCNTGYSNTGNRNTGDWNTGNRNTGDCNTGYSNTGNRNTGDWNTGNRNTGVFCTNKNPTIKLFDAESKWTMATWNSSMACQVMSGCPCSHSEFVWANDMTDEEKEKHPEHKTIGGYIKIITVTAEDKQKWWDGLPEDAKQAVYGLPNFDPDKFKQCTEIEVENGD